MHTDFFNALRSVASVAGAVLAQAHTPMGRDEYVRIALADEMRRHTGCKRIRKKKAKIVLARRWTARTMALPIARRLNYSEMVRDMFKVEPMPSPTGRTYHDPNR